MGSGWPLVVALGVIAGVTYLVGQIVHASNPKPRVAVVSPNGLHNKGFRVLLEASVFLRSAPLDLPMVGRTQRRPSEKVMIQGALEDRV